MRYCSSLLKHIDDGVVPTIAVNAEVCAALLGACAEAGCVEGAEAAKQLLCQYMPLIGIVPEPELVGPAVMACERGNDNPSAFRIFVELKDILPLSIDTYLCAARAALALVPEEGMMAYAAHLILQEVRGRGETADAATHLAVLRAGREKGVDPVENDIALLLLNDVIACRGIRWCPLLMYTCAMCRVAELIDTAVLRGFHQIAAAATCDVGQLVEKQEVLVEEVMEIIIQLHDGLQAYAEQELFNAARV